MRHFAAVCVCIAVCWVGNALADEPQKPADPDALPAGALMRLGRSRFHVHGDVLAIDFSPDGSTMAVATDPHFSDGSLQLFTT